ncbi:MAG: UDP-N-acetylmuramate--L-alanine ligase [Propionibacteriaceae bacterium]|jgi:UDP-N-acetylmuramate--alanine ligase|nr:UDP-N-acetylmuramate--L-alanine ligase [Propionibacteriaceae bacterium]
MSLREREPLLPTSELGAVHFIAIGGAGMSGIAHMFHALGSRVSGCDQADSVALQELSAAGVEVSIGHDAAHIDGADTIVVSSAIREDNPELVAARAAGKRIWHRSQALASLMLGHHGVAVAGTHGKTTTTGLLTSMLATSGLDPSYVIGAPMAATGKSWHLGSGDIFVVEADESDGSFLQYPVRTAIVTNVEADHLDNWGTPQAYAAGFERFVSSPTLQHVILNLNDAGARRLAAGLDANGWSERVYGYAHPPVTPVAASLFVDGLRETSTGIQARTHGPHLCPDANLSLKLHGRHNIENAAAALLAAQLLGAGQAAALLGASTFGGAERRFQAVGNVSGVAGVRVFDDYAHHPSEISATLSAARAVAGEGRVIAAFQPHLYTRTRDFASQFGAALSAADEVVLTDIYAAREDPIPGVTGRLILRAVSAPSHWVPAREDVAAALQQIVKLGDVVVTLGAGNITQVGPELVELLRAAGEPSA